MEKIERSPEVMARAYREDDLMYVFRAFQSGISVDDLLEGAEKMRAFMESTSAGERPEWAQVSAMVDTIDERDRARDTAVRLEQELAEAEKRLNERNDNLVKGVLLELTRQGNHTLTEAGRIAIKRAVSNAAEKFGVTL